MTYTKLTIQIQTKDKSPYFIGSMLRGALGYSLKKVTCINPSFKCEGCFAQHSCIYYSFYEKENVFHKYRFEIELGSGKFDFALYLFDDACDGLPYVLSALEMMLKKIGLGKDRKLYPNFALYINDDLANANNQITMPKKFIKSFQIDDFCPDVEIKFLTPLRMKKHKRFIRDEKIELKDIIHSIYQRALQVQNKNRQKLDFEIEGQIISKSIKYKELTRQSNRQKTKMNLGGIMGSMEIIGLNQKTYEILKLGELIAVGKSTVFGLGKIKVEELRCR